MDAKTTRGATPVDQDSHATMAAEIVRLRAALQSIADREFQNNPKVLRDLAREALA